MKYLIFFIAYLLALASAINYKDNRGGKTATYTVPSINGNYNSNEAGRDTVVFELDPTLLMKSLNNKISVNYTKIGEYEFDVINNVGSTVGVKCNDVASTANRLGSTKTFVADVTDAVRAIGDPSVSSGDLSCIWTEHVVSPGSNKGNKKAPKLTLFNNEIQTSIPEGWLKSVVLNNVGDQSKTVNATWLQVGDCNNPDLITWVYHPQPSSANTLVGMLAELERQTLPSEKNCFLAPHQFGSGYTTLVGSEQEHSLNRDDHYDTVTGFTERFYTDIVAPMRGVNTEVDFIGIEYNSRFYGYLPLRFPGAFRNVGCNTCFVNPCSDASEMNCKYDPTKNITSTVLFNYLVNELGFSQVDATARSSWPCDPTVPAKLPQLLGPDGLNDESICGPYSIHSCQGQCGKRGSLGAFLDSFGDNPTSHSTYDFGQFFIGTEPYLGEDGAFEQMCNAKFGPLGFGTASGQNLFFCLRDLQASEISLLDEPHSFDGFGTDPGKVAAACASAAPNSVAAGQMPQPHLTQMFPTTMLDADGTELTVWGVLPSALENAKARAQYDETQAALLDGSLKTKITGNLMMFASDVSLGAFGGPKYTNDINNAVKFQWQFGESNIQDYRDTDHDVIAIGPAGGHVGAAMDQPDVFAGEYLKYIRSA